jgi:1,4-dihydroxy-6-naphthoate synthase
MRRHAQEFDDHVLMQHVELYVNEWTRDLGATGRRALDELSRRAATVSENGGGASAADPPRLEIFAG